MLSVSIGPLKRREGPGVIPAASVQWNFVRGIRIEKNTRKIRPSDLIRPAPALFPDCLDDARQYTVSKGSLKSVYLTIRIPRDAEPGEYRGEVAAASGGARVALPLLLTVYPLTLPDQRHVMVTEWFSTGRFAQFHGVNPNDPEQYDKMLRVYADNMADHRQNVFRVSLGLITSVRAADGQLRFDFSPFDRFAQVFWDTGRMDLPGDRLRRPLRRGGLVEPPGRAQRFPRAGRGDGPDEADAGQGVPAPVPAGPGEAPAREGLARKDASSTSPTSLPTTTS